jgi:hypothetical protein
MVRDGGHPALGSAAAELAVSPVFERDLLKGATNYKTLLTNLALTSADVSHVQVRRHSLSTPFLYAHPAPAAS